MFSALVAPHMDIDRCLMKPEYVSLLFKAGTAILLLWAIYWLIVKLTGHSPTMDQMQLIIFSAVLGLSLSTAYKTGKIEGILQEHIQQCRHYEQKLNAIEKIVKDKAIIT